MHNAIAPICALLFLFGCSKSVPSPDLKSKVDQFIAKAKESFAQVPAGYHLSVDELSTSVTFSQYWNLKSKDNWGGKYSNIYELIFISNENLSKENGVNKMLLKILVCKDASSARDLALQESFSGAAPTEYLLERNIKYFGQKDNPGDFRFGPDMFVRWNMVVNINATDNKSVPCLVDTLLQKIPKETKEIDKK